MFKKKNCDGLCLGMRITAEVVAEQFCFIRQRGKADLLLTGKEKQLFLDFVNAQSSVNSIAAIESYIIGFRFGVRIGIMDNKDGVLRDIL